MTLTVAVVVPTIPGREEMLDRALASVATQDREPDQLIVRLDAAREGAAHARNHALEEVTTDVVCWLDDDDELLPSHVRRLTHVLERWDRFDLVYPIPQMVPSTTPDPTATSLDGRWVPPWRIPFGPEQEYHLRSFGSFIPITHAVRTAVVRKAGGFPIPGTPEWPRPNVEDWGYLIRLLDAGATFYHLPAVTWRWHVHGAHTGGEPGR